MILTDCDGNSTIFIDESLEEFITVTRDDDVPQSKYIYMKDNENIIYNILFSDQKMTLANIKEIFYDAEDNRLWFYDHKIDCIADKILNDDEIISLSFCEEQESFKVINITTMKLPEFLDDETYPKIEFNISDCIYSMRIYNNDHEYLDIPKFQSHDNINSTLEYISRLVYYLTEWRPKFINFICNNEEMSLIITDKNNHRLNYGIIKYKLGEEGLYITGGELENYLVVWQKFFKLVMDGTWEVGFADE